MIIENGVLSHWNGAPFNGAKAALICGSDLVAFRRDTRPDIAWPGRIDLPGGGREPGESPISCVIREIREEIGLSLPRERFRWARAYAVEDGADPVWFLTARIDVSETKGLRLSDEGQACWMMPVAAFRTNPQVVPSLRARLGDYVDR